MRQAVLFRSSDHSDWLELALMRANIPYFKFGGLKFLEVAHVKDFLSVLRWADNPKNGLAAFRALQLLPGMGPANAARCWKHFVEGGLRMAGLAQFEVPAAAAEPWPRFSALMAGLVRPQPEWPDQVAEVRAWYEPELTRLYECSAVRAGDLEMLEQLARQFARRERFLSELTLDPPAATGDRSGPPLKDEDYLVLSTVHSAKGQEWDSVHVLNVNDGSFPNEFATGSAAGIDEERRLLYVAMTRARFELHLLEPQRHYVTQQAPLGDRHVYGGVRSRFLDGPLLELFDLSAWPEGPELAENRATASTVRVDAGAKLRSLW